MTISSVKEKYPHAYEVLSRANVPPSVMEKEFPPDWVLAAMDEAWGRISCVYCGTVTDGKGLTPEQLGEAINSHILSCEKRPERKILNCLLLICTIFGVDVESIPSGDSGALAEAIQKKVLEVLDDQKYPDITFEED